MLSSNDVVNQDDKFNKINKVPNELKTLISKIKSEGISMELSNEILRECFLSVEVIIGEGREHISVLKSIYSNKPYTLREFIRFNKSATYKKAFSFPVLNLSECDGDLVITKKEDERIVTITNAGRPSLLVDELKLISEPTNKKSIVYKTPFPFLEKVSLKPINEEGFEWAFNLYIKKRVIAELKYVLKIYTTSDFMSYERVESMLKMLQNLNNKNKG